MLPGCDCSEETKTSNEEKEITSLVFSSSNPSNGEGVDISQKVDELNLNQT